MSTYSKSMLRTFRNYTFALALSLVFTSTAIDDANAGGWWIAGAIIGGLVAGAIVHHSYAGHYGYPGYYHHKYRPVIKVRVVKKRHHRRNRNFMRCAKNGHRQGGLRIGGAQNRQGRLFAHDKRVS